MPVQATVIATLLSIALSAGGTPVERISADTENEPNSVALAIVESKVTEKTLGVRYQITNGLQRDIWICESILSRRLGAGGIDHEVYLSEDSRTLVIRRRLNVPGGGHTSQPSYAAYFRLSAGEQRSESVVLPLPVRSAMLFYPRRDVNTPSAMRLRMEIGFHDFNLAEQTFDKLGEVAKFDAIMTRRDRIFLCPYPGPFLRGYRKRERTVWAEADVPRIPYVPKTMHSVPHSEWPTPPDLVLCTRVNVEYHPSVLEYFFPDPEAQSLLSDAEKQSLRSQKAASMDRPEQIAAFRYEIGRGEWSLVVAEETRAYVTCYSDDKRLTSFAVFGEGRLLMNDGTQFRSVNPLASLRALTPQIEPFRLRTQRARVLRSFWYEVRAWHRGHAGVALDSSGEDAIRYPPASKWNEAIRRAYRETERENPIGESYREGACEYAMNPDCEPNSPPDTVLLFETQVGWNQHGGPELFTFDNHDPRGGLVLLNDGTVKFIRTEEELNQLRWR